MYIIHICMGRYRFSIIQISRDENSVDLGLKIALETYQKVKEFR